MSSAGQGGRRAGVGGALLFFALALCFAWRRWLAGEHSPFARDIEFYHHPVTRELVDAWSQGRIPLWTDRVYCGFPFFADSQTAAWYPGTLLVAALGPHSGYVAFLLLHALLAAVGTLLLLRAHGGGWLPGLAVGLVVPLSGFFVYETQHPGLFAILCWIPLWLLTTRAVFLRPSPGKLALAALPPTLMVLAGTLQVLFGAILLFGVYGLTLILEVRSREAALRGVAAAGAAQLLGLALSAVVWVPAFAHFPHTARALGMEYAFGSMGSAHPLELLGHVLRGAVALDPGADFGFGAASFYLGALTLPLALVGALAVPRAVPIALAVACGALGALALGRHGFLHPLLYEWLPGAGALRGVGRALGPAVVCLALLAGFGLSRVAEGRGKRPLALGLLAALLAQGLVSSRAPAPTAGDIAAMAVLCAALGLVVAARRRPALLQTGLAALLLAELLLFGPSDERLRSDPPPPGEAQLQGALRFPALGRIAAGKVGGGDDAAAADGRVLLLGFGTANFTFHHELDGVGGYNPLVPLQYLDWVRRVNDGQAFPREPIGGFVHYAVPARPEAGLFDAGSARFLISGQPLAGEGLELLERYGPHPLTGRPVLLYENTDALPRAYLAYRTRRVEGREALDAALASDFEPRETTVFEGDTSALDGPAHIDPVRVERPRPERLQAEVALDRPALLVLTDSWYPGWRAAVDGVEAPVLRVNGNFRGVPLPASARRVELRFEPASFRVGAVLSGLALLALAGLAGGSLVRGFPRGRA